MPLASCLGSPEELFASDKLTLILARLYRRPGFCFMLNGRFHIASMFAHRVLDKPLIYIQFSLENCSHKGLRKQTIIK